MKRRNSISIAVPASMVSEIAHLREKTIVLGQLGRAAGIYRVDEIIIYRDKPDESLLMKYVLGYLETPQYLRKHLFDHRDELQFAGMLPPLRTPHHPTSTHSDTLNEGEYRDGVVVSSDEAGFMVDIGVNAPLRIRGKSPAKGARVITQVMDLEGLPRGRLVKKRRIDEYWGYSLRGSKGKLSDLVHNPEWDLTIGTSKLGDNIGDVSEAIQVRWQESGKTLIVFGSYKEGVGEIMERQGRRAEEIFDFIVNTVPEQGTATVRTEEAVHATLAIFNIFKD
jgi:predicted SPOUT superfamily RNA methylase MTH1